MLEYCLNNIARNFLVALLFLNSDIADDKSFLFRRLIISNFILLILLILYLKQPLGPLGFMLSVSCILSTPSTAYKNLSIRLWENSGEGANTFFWCKYSFSVYAEYFMMLQVMMLFYWFYRIYWKHLFILNAFIIVFMFYFIMFIFPLYSNFLSFIWLPQASFGWLLMTQPFSCNVNNPLCCKFSLKVMVNLVARLGPKAWPSSQWDFNCEAFDS